MVSVRLHSTLRRPTPTGYQSRFTVELDEEAGVADLLAALELDLSPEHLLVLIDRRRVGPEHRLQDGDQVQLFPPISGG